jgi:hypothetical protein
VRVAIEVWLDQVGNFGFADVELEHGCFFGAIDHARGITFVEPEQEINGI